MCKEEISNINKSMSKSLEINQEILKIIRALAEEVATIQHKNHETLKELVNYIKEDIRK